MKTPTFPAVFAVFAISVLFVSCSHFIDPAWKADDGATRFAVTLGSKPAERALVRGSGFLYIRTIGGPSSATGPYYGPYPVSSGDTFISTELPAGSYEGIGIIVASKRLDSLTGVFAGQTLTFSEAMMLPDDQFNEFTDGSGGDSPFNAMLDGYASGYLIKDPVLRSGVINSFSITLEPMTSPASTLSFSGSGSVVLTPLVASATERRFVSLDDAITSSDSTVLAVDWQISAGSSPVTLGTVALFDEKGNQIVSYQDVGLIAAGGSKSFAAGVVSGWRYHVYLEYTTASSITLTAKTLAVEGPGTGNLTVVFNTAACAGRKLFYGVYDAASIGPYGPIANPVAIGMMTLDSSGHGASQPYLLGATTPAVLPTTTTYRINAFVDMNGNYASITGMSAIGNIDGITPHYGDFASDNTVTVSVAGTGGVLTFDPAVFSTMTRHVYFASLAGSAMTDGQLITTAVDIDTALSLAQTNAPAEIKIVDSVAITTPKSITADVTIGSAGFSRKSIAFSSTTASINVQTAGNLQLSNVVLDGLSLARTQAPLMVMGDCSLYNTDIRNSFSGAMGGAVNVSSAATLYMERGVITQCSASYGGGIYCSANSTLGIGPGASVTGNTATMGLGGDVFLDPSATYTNTGGTVGVLYQ